MANDTIDYPRLVLGALRQAIAGVLRRVAEEGLPGEHHFYLTFRTDAPGVEIPPGLRRDNPDELTIVLQHQFWSLVVDDDGFSVTLRFAGVETPVRVPFDALTAFADPSVDFGVQLALPAAPGDGEDPTGGNDPGRPSSDGTVLSFDRRRKRD